MSVNNVETLLDQTLRDSDLSAKQKAVLRASLTLFAQQGYARTSTADIARAAGVSEGTVYKRFKTKADLLAALMQPFMAQVVPKVAGEFGDATMTQLPPDFETLLHRVIVDRMQFAIANYQVVKIFAAEALQRPELLQRVQGAFDQLVTTRITPALVHYQQRGQLVNWPPQLIVRYIAGTLIGDVLPSLLVSHASIDVAARAAEDTRFLMKGLRPE
ncbi:TetR/AcrR family transcriptional regulator [Lacticaseibacillus absianus]|uniref:TetR/AcrR family transcriptional regulator n=1 Tax=Lacticaseibacillus absianus TaxID=2729623 RepID=UPI0015CA0520|nr:TetR/AcrR family transcriptional regulator [Lacticaseibacillus absianus]